MAKINNPERGLLGVLPKKTGAATPAETPKDPAIKKHFIARENYLEVVAKAEDAARAMPLSERQIRLANRESDSKDRPIEHMRSRHHGPHAKAKRSIMKDAASITQPGKQPTRPDVDTGDSIGISYAHK